MSCADKLGAFVLDVGTATTKVFNVVPVSKVIVF